MCEKFSAGKCLGCQAMEGSIDEVKQYCEDYKKFMGIYEQMEINK